MKITIRRIQPVIIIHAGTIWSGWVFSLVLALCLSAATAAGPRNDPKNRNLALGKPYKILPTPNYGLTQKGDTDEKDLTDGKVSGKDKIWFDSRAVGIQRHCNALIRLDLGKTEPIDEVNIRLQGGVADQAHVFPDLVELLLSDDGETFYLIDDFRFWRLGDR
ncbi:MAG: hypothetical protein JXA11_03390, partial [Phycisphaerae bacterium]|nr:hypothetical protein [Phycisphaerae bacterium]